ncbi:hypothetical protein COO60DRAFT_1502270, partial [Scenedesmus sp. NREL 46B-D3]
MRLHMKGLLPTMLAGSPCGTVPLTLQSMQHQCFAHNAHNLKRASSAGHSSAPDLCSTTKQPSLQATCVQMQQPQCSGVTSAFSGGTVHKAYAAVSSCVAQHTRGMIPK